jgi:hypothetical protein
MGFDRGRIPDHISPAQFAWHQRVNDFGNYVSHLKSTGNNDELARIAGVFDSADTTKFLADMAERRGHSPESVDLMYRDPDTAMISLSEEGPDFHQEHRSRMSKLSSTVGPYRTVELRKKRETRLKDAESTRAVRRGMDAPPSGPRRSPITGEITDNSYSFIKGRNR